MSILYDIIKNMSIIGDIMDKNQYIFKGIQKGGEKLMGKRNLTEEDIKMRYITPAIINAGWDKKQIRLEYSFTAGRIILRGNITARGKQKSRLSTFI